MRKRILELSEEQRRELDDMRDHHPTAYLRERAAALLKIADGMSALAVAHGGLLRRRKPDTVYGWLNAYQEKGTKGLFQRSRRGGKILEE
jgi:transposase